MSIRWWLLGGFLVCAALMAAALYFQYAMYMDPCPLCIFQRVAVIAVGIVCLLGFVHDPAGAGRTVYGVLVVMFSLVGAALAGRQVWLQHLPPDKVPECGPGLDYMMEVLPLLDVVRKVLSGSGECAEVNWVFLGLTIPGWTSLFFAAFAVFGVVVARSRPVPPRSD